MKLINGLQVAEEIKQKVKEEIGSRDLHLKLAIIYAGDNQASEIYVDKKLNWAKEVGIDTELIRLTETTEEDLIAIIERLNKDTETTGYIVQLPLPKNISTRKVLAKISPKKDIDGLSPVSLGGLFHNDEKNFVFLFSSCPGP